MKRVIVLAAVLALAVCLAGCSGNGKDIEEKVTGFVDSLEDKLDQVEDGLGKLEDKLNGIADDTPAETQAPEPTQEPEPTQAQAEAVSEDAVRSEIKEAIDSYEEFFNQYADFMESYDASDLSALTEYLSMVQQYTETMEKLDAMEDADLTAAELAYYTQAMLRIDQRLLEVAG